MIIAVRAVLYRISLATGGCDRPRRAPAARFDQQTVGGRAYHATDQTPVVNLMFMLGWVALITVQIAMGMGGVPGGGGAP